VPRSLQSGTLLQIADALCPPCPILRGVPLARSPLNAEESSVIESLRPLRVLATCLLLLSPLAQAGNPASQDEDPELAELLREEREDADRMRRHGDFVGARKLLNMHLRDDPEDLAARLSLGLVYLDQGRLDVAESHLQAALNGDVLPHVKQRAARGLAHLMHRLGRDQEAQDNLFPALLDGAAPEPRSLYVAAEVAGALGHHDQARELYKKGAVAGPEGDWQVLLGRGQCLQRLGRIEQSGNVLLAANTLSREDGGRGEADVLVAIGNLFFEADREVEEGEGRSAAKAYDDALRLNASHEGALLGLYHLHRVNWLRQRRNASDFLNKMLELRPQSVEAHLAAAGNHLRVGRLPGVRVELAALELIAPMRREVLTLRASLAWVEHDREGAEQILAELNAMDPLDSQPERMVGKHLLELYRFAEAKPFLERAVERDSTDHSAWSHLGNALANVGDEEGALKALQRSRREGGLRQDAWRKNMTMVLERLDREYIVRDFGELSFAWKPDAAPVLEVYLEPFYREAREELSERYSYTPSPTHIEVFRRHRDFSVRSTGFEGFPALGVCFGPVVTALSPLSELRGSFSWARTSFHEFTHVIHLGLSHNRCPRWITEGLATWEEAHSNPAWARNLRRELVDSHANGTIIPVRDLNAAFRGPRIIFGYYEGGLICEMLIERYGFPPMIHLLEAFDRGLDLDEALGTVFDLTPEQLDASLLERVQDKVDQLQIEPRWDQAVLPMRRMALGEVAPTGVDERAEWVDGWCTQAWGAWQNGRQLDAQEALRRLAEVSEDPPRALLLKGEMARRDGDNQRAQEFWERAFDAGGEDFHAHVFVGRWLQNAGDMEAAEEHYKAAERAFPGYKDVELAAELKLVSLYIDLDRRDDAMAAAERYLLYDAGSYKWRRRVATWHLEHERYDKAVVLLQEANEIDPFSRALHLEWGYGLERAERYEEALREYKVVALVPVELDLEAGMPMLARESADLLGRRARCLVHLKRFEEAQQLLDEVALLPEEAQKGLASLEEARELLEAALE
jgi:tetratricopeptide (TPR) repeat protein